MEGRRIGNGEEVFIHSTSTEEARESQGSNEEVQDTTGSSGGYNGAVREQKDE